MIEKLELIDRTIFLFINGLHNPFFDSLMWFVSGKLSWAPLYAIILFFVFKKEKKHWWLILISIIVLITMADQSSVKLFKEVFLRYRPCHNLEIEHLVHKVNNKCGGTYGFVSSHAANVFALASFLSLFFNKKLFSIGIFTWAALVGYSRIYLGVHYPADVFFGGLLGILCGSIVYFTYQKTKLRLSKP